VLEELRRPGRGIAGLLAHQLNGLVVVRCVYASAQIAPSMYATEQSLLRWRLILESVKFRATAIARNIRARTDMGSVDDFGGYPDQMTRGST